MNRLIAVLLVSGLLSSSWAKDADPEVVVARGRAVSASCGYYTQTVADFEVLYRDESLPWGSQVSVIYGFGGLDESSSSRADQRFDWASVSEKEAVASAPYTWSTRFSQVLHFRSSPKRFDSLQFVIQVVLPQGQRHYFRGSLTPMGFIQAALPFVGKSPCQDGSDEKNNPFVSLSLKSVDRQ